MTWEELLGNGGGPAYGANSLNSEDDFRALPLTAGLQPQRAEVGCAYSQQARLNVAVAGLPRGPPSLGLKVPLSAFPISLFTCCVSKLVSQRA